MEVEKSSLCNFVVNFLLEENYVLTAFELLHELLDDGRHDQAIRLQQHFSNPSKFPPNQISRFNSLTRHLLSLSLSHFTLYFPLLFLQNQIKSNPIQSRLHFAFCSGRSSNAAPTQRRSGREVSHHGLRTAFGTGRPLKTHNSIANQNSMPQSTTRYI